MVKYSSLPKRLKALGFSLFEPEETEDANLTLADVVKSRDLRMWEGFPTILANSATRGLFNHSKAVSYLKKPADKSYFESLMAMSLALYKVSGTKFSWSDALYNSLTAGQKKECSMFFGMFKEGSDLKFGSYKMPAQRLKTTFNNYLNQSGPKLNELLLAKEELGLEYALSQVFSPKQKDLFLKKLKGEKLTKTEKEYFSRVVKKKVLALVNPELHRLSQKLLE